MKKTTALELLGGDVRSAAKHLGVTVRAVQQWPAKLPRASADRVIATVVRARARRMKRARVPLDPLEADAVAL